MTSDDVHARHYVDSKGAHIVAVTGQVDLATADAFARVLAAAAVGRAQLTADLTGLGFLGSAGIRVLFDLAAQIDLELIVNPHSVIAATLDVCGMGEAATMRETGLIGPGSSAAE